MDYDHVSNISYGKRIKYVWEMVVLSNMGNEITEEVFKVIDYPFY